MRQSTLTKLGLLVFGLVFVAFVIRGFGQFLVGPRRATLLAGPVALLAALVLLVVLGAWMLSAAGLLAVEPDDTDA